MEKIIETKNLTHIYSAGTPFQRAALTGVDFHAYELIRSGQLTLRK